MPSLIEFQTPSQVRAGRGCCSCSLAAAAGAFAAALTAIISFVRRN